MNKYHPEIEEYAFDIKEWQPALEAFRKVRPENLHRGYWEQIKHLELIGCCQMELNFVEKGIHFLTINVIPAYENGDYNDYISERGSLAYPTEMLGTLEKFGYSDLAKKIETTLK